MRRVNHPNHGRYAKRRIRDDLVLIPDRGLTMWDDRDGNHYVLGPDSLSAWADGATETLKPPGNMADGLYRDGDHANVIWIKEHGRLERLRLFPAVPLRESGPWRRHRFR